MQNQLDNKEEIKDDKYYMKLIEIYRDKSLRLDNVLIYNVVDFSTLSPEDGKDADLDNFSMGIEVIKMENQIKSKGAKQVGPLIQFSGTNKKSEEDIEIKMSLMVAYI